MKQLSSLVGENIVTLLEGYAYFKVGEFRVCRRKVCSKAFSNYSVDTVNYCGDKYLLDSKLNIEHI